MFVVKHQLRYMQRIRFFVYVLLANLLVATFAHAENDILGRAYFLDSSNSLSFKQVQRESFTPYEGVLTGGFQKGTYWLKLRVRQTDDELVLRIRPIFTEEIELFESNSVEKKSIIGAKHSWRNNQVQRTR